MRTLAAVLTLALPLVAEDVTGWTKAKWGMSPAEVLEMFKAEGAVPLDEPNRLKVGLPAYQIGETTYTVSFRFDESDKLTIVLLEPKASPVARLQFNLLGDMMRFNRDVDVLRGERIRISSLLHEKYGNPSKEEAIPVGRTEGFWSDTWNCESGSVRATLAVHFQLPSTYTIVYTAKSKDTGKL